MTIRVYHVADIVEGNVRLCGDPIIHTGDVVALLTNLQPVVDPLTHGWTLDLVIGEGSAERSIRIDLCSVIPKSHSPSSPLFLTREPRGEQDIASWPYLLSRSPIYI